MVEPSVVRQAKQWGYALLPCHNPTCPGWAGLVIVLREKPVGAFFETELVDLWIRNETGMVTLNHLAFTPHPRGSRHVCPGKLVLQNRRADERLHFFTFGGSLEIVAGDDPLVYALMSAAPILKLGELTGPAKGQLAIEAEVLLPRLRAGWDRDDSGFLCKLAQADP